MGLMQPCRCASTPRIWPRISWQTSRRDRTSPGRPGVLVQADRGNEDGMLYTILVVIAALILAAIALNLVRSGGRRI